MAINATTTLLLQTVHQDERAHHRPQSTRSRSSQQHQIYCYCHHPQLTKMFVGYYMLLGLIALSLPSALYTSPTPSSDLCTSRDSVDSAAKVLLTNGIEKLFLSSGKHYWLVDPETERPEANASMLLPYDFEPDVAIEKDTSECRYGSRSLLLIRFAHDRITGTIEWFGLAGEPNAQDITWGSVVRLAKCEPDVKSCIIDENYLTMARFDFKRKLDAAFGTIGKVVYFIQGDKMSKIVYHTPCVGKNPVQDMNGYEPVDIPTHQVTAAFSKYNAADNYTIVLFDNDIHINITQSVIETVTFTDAELDLSLWLDNVPNFFKACSMDDALWASVFAELFTSGSRRHQKAQMILLIVVVAIIALTIGLVLLFIKLRRSQRHGVRPRADEHDVVVASVELETTPITGGDKIATINGNETEKKLLQTSC